tara:strand:+ start:431 stop:655 length:225 start_codon:yes stop_codon:yes gene_type:complete
VLPTTTRPILKLQPSHAQLKLHAFKFNFKFSLNTFFKWSNARFKSCEATLKPEMIQQNDIKKAFKDSSQSPQRL